MAGVLWNNTALLAASLLLLSTTGSSTFVHQAASEPSDHTLKSSKCSYLERSDENQDNAFIWNKLECCMCPRGYRYAGICNATHPNTTQCIPCEEGSYIHYTVHLVKTCLIRPANCRHPFVSVFRSTTERPSCVCPEGMVKSDGDCVEEKTSAPIQLTTTATTTTPATTTSLTTRTQTMTALTKKPDERRVTANKSTPHKGIDPSLPTAAQDSAEANINEGSEKTATTQSTKRIIHALTGIGSSKDVAEQGGGGLNILMISLLCVAVVVILLGFICWKYRGRLLQPQSTHEDNKSNASGETTPTSSHSTLLRKGRENTMSNPRNSRLEEEGLVQHQQNYESGLEPTTINEISEVPDKMNSAGPIRGFAAENGVETEDHRGVFQPQADQEIPPDQQQNCVCRNCWERNKTFAETVGTEFGFLPKNDALRIFRFILGRDKDEQEFRNLQTAHADNKEFIYQLMQLTIRKKGKRLTPSYLLDRVSNADPKLQELIDIIEDEMKKPYMTNSPCLHCGQPAVQG